MNTMFQKCHEIEKLNLSSFDTSNVNNMLCMFGECHKLKEIKGIDKFNTSNVNTMKPMFQECHEIEIFDLSSFDTSNVIDMCLMFNAYKKLKE